MDLVVIGSANLGRAGSFLFGSVARALTIGCKQSVLITKGDRILDPPSKAIFATDHSIYANRALEKLIQWAPTGLKQIDVVRAYEESEFDIPSQSAGERYTEAKEFLEQHLLTGCELKCAKLRHAGYESNPHIRLGPPNIALSQLMKDCEADLIVLGAQGHGFFERLMVGSVALHQVTSESYPVLLIRA